MLIHFIGKKWYKNILVYNISYKSLITAKPLSIRFNKVDGSIRVSDGTRYLALFGPEKCDATYNRIRYVKKRYQKSSIHMVFFFNYSRIKTDSCDFLPLEKTLALHVLMLTNLVLIYSYKNVLTNYLKLMIINKFLYKL